MDDLDLLTLLVTGILMVAGLMVPVTVRNHGVRRTDAAHDQQTPDISARQH